MTMPLKSKPEHEVNTYLFYAQQLLNLKGKVSLIESQSEDMALMASACLSLQQAWTAWLKELSVIVGKDIVSVSALQSHEHKHHPEVQVLNELYNNKRSWLVGLLGFCEPRLNKPSPTSTAEGEPEDVTALSRKINLVHLELETGLSEEERLSGVIHDFKAYITEVRGRQAEW